MTEKNYEERLKEWERAKFAPPPEPELTPVTPTMVEMVPMRDGVRLYTEIFLPITTGCFPVVLLRSPYPYTCPSRNDKRPLSRYLEAGYAVVFQMTRGQYKSEGRFHFHKDDVDDGYDCINWIAAQSWCDGNVGMEGASYLGNVQLLAARSRPKALKCIMPTAFLGNLFVLFPYAGGIFTRGWMMQWYKVADTESMADLDSTYGDMSIIRHPLWGPALRKRPLIDAANEILSGDKLKSWRDIISHPLDNEYWHSIHFTDEQLTELELPMFFTDGWYDPTIGPIDFFTRLDRLQPGRDDRYLLVGPWNHYQTYSSHLHDQDNGDHKVPENGKMDLVAQRLAFYDRYLRGNTNNQIQQDRVRVYITNANIWCDFPTFPPPGMKRRCLYLHSEGDARSFPGDGLLTWETPLDENPDSYIYDPSLPTPSEAEPLRDRREIEVRSDVLTYSSQPLKKPLVILGEIKLVLYAASDATDTDWFAQVTEVFPDGKSIAFHGTLGALRARYRQGFDKEILLTPGEPTKFLIAVGPAGHQILPGNRLRLSIFSANFPVCDANTNTGNPPATDTGMCIAKQTVFHDVSRPSHLVIPVIDLNE